MYKDAALSLIIHYTSLPHDPVDISFICISLSTNYNNFLNHHDGWMYVLALFLPHPIV